MSEILRLSFLAQSLDNCAPDPMQQEGRLLAPEDHFGRKSLVDRVAHVSVFGTRVFIGGSVSAYLDRKNNDFIVEVPSEETDTVGRVAPIVCHGDSRKHMDAGKVEHELRQFARRIGRSISPADVELAQKGLKAVEDEAVEDERCWVRRIGNLGSSVRILSKRTRPLQKKLGRAPVSTSAKENT